MQNPKETVKIGDELNTGTSQADLARGDTAGNLTTNLMPLDLTITGTVQICDKSKIALILSGIKYGNEKGFKRIGGDIKTKIIDGKELEMIDEEFFFMGNNGSSVTIHISTHNSIKFATIDYLGNGVLAGLEYKEMGDDYLSELNLELTHGDITVPELIELIYQTLNSSAP